MNPPSSTARLIVTCSFGLEALIRREIEDLGFQDLSGADGRIEFDARLEDIPTLNINLRVADRVLLKLAEFPAADFDQFFEGVSQVVWERWLPRDAKITVTGKCVKSQLASVRSCQSIAKKAIITRLQDEFDIEVLPESGDEYVVQVAVFKDMVLVTLDTTGPGLHKRGYRHDMGEAPMRENLAAALVLLSSWRGQGLLIDPMCGSGTILIEAAMMARRIAPGLDRNFAAESWDCIESCVWQKARDSARLVQLKESELVIKGYDIDPARVEDAQANARRAGVGQDIVFGVEDVRKLWVSQSSGVLVCNPPYGVKLGSLKELTGIYLSLHKTFRNKPGWALFFLTADDRFPNFFKRARPDKVRKLYNGNIETNYYQYFAAGPVEKEGQKES